MSTAQTPKIYISRIPSFDPAALAPEIAKATQSLSDAETRYQDARAVYGRGIHGGIWSGVDETTQKAIWRDQPAERIAKDLQRAETEKLGRGARRFGVSPRILNDLMNLRLERDEAKAKVRGLQADAAKPATPAKVVITITKSYEIKEKLKARGYRYDPDARWLGLLGEAGAEPGWVKVVSLEEAENEMLALIGIGTFIEAGLLVNFVTSLRYS